MSRKYVTVLALAAAVILIGGSVLRPVPRKKSGAAGHDTAPTPVATAAPSHRSQMRQISDYLSDRADRAATHMVVLPDTGASGVVWPDGKVLTSSRSAGLLEARIENVTAPPVMLAAPERFNQTGWIVAVARTADNHVLSSSGLLGGVADAHCGNETVRKLVFNTPLDATFAGAGVFEISGDLLGVVIRCNDAWTAITWQSAQNLIREHSGPSEEVWQSFGIRVSEADADTRSLMKLPKSSGLFLSEVRRASRAFQTGLRPGDLVVRLADKPVTEIANLSAIQQTTITVLRGGKQLTLDTNPPFALEPAPAAPVLTSVAAGTRLHAAGLRAGDRIVRANGIEDPGPTDLNRLFASDKPAWLVYERENRRVWTMLR